MAGQVPREVVQERYERLVALQDELSLAANRALVGSTVEVLVAEGEGRKDARHRPAVRAGPGRAAGALRLRAGRGAARATW